MTLRDELHAVMVEIQQARRVVADVQSLRLMRQRRLTELETALSTAQRVLMARTEAGTNDTQRRAYAERETASDREAIITAQRAVVDADIDLTQAQATLRIALDRRQYLEAVATLNVDGDLFRDVEETELAY